MPSLVTIHLLLACSQSTISPAPQETQTARATVKGSPPVLRVAAEWEPALGVLLRWPPAVPRLLFVEIARDSCLYVMVEDEPTAREAREHFDRWGIDNDAYVFIQLPGTDDAEWPRDWGPHPVFTQEGILELADARYDLSTPDSGLACDAELETPWNGGWGKEFLDYDVTKDDVAPAVVASALNHPCRTLDFVLTGGNFLVDGRGGAISTCILLNENDRNGVSEARFLELTRSLLGIERYGILSNFEDNGIQHADCLLKPLEGDRLLVARPPRDHALYDRYEQLADEIRAGLRTASNLPYEILRIDTARYADQKLAAYTNALIVNRVVYVPLFDIPQDEEALRTWGEALPGHEIKGIPFRLEEEEFLAPKARRMYPDGIGWRNFDALHCRTRAVWDPDMLHLSVEGPPPEISPGQTAAISARIVPYSGAPLLADEVAVHWRYEGEIAWTRQLLQRTDDGSFHFEFPELQAGRTVQYCVSATDLSGRCETSPRCAPQASWQFRVEDR